MAVMYNRTWNFSSMLDRMRPVTTRLFFCSSRRASCRCKVSKADAIDRAPRLPTITPIAALQSCLNSNRKQTTPTLEIALQVNIHIILKTLKLSCSLKKGVRTTSQFQGSYCSPFENIHTHDFTRKTLGVNVYSTLQDRSHSLCRASSALPRDVTRRLPTD